MTHDGHHHMTHRLRQCERRQPRGRNLFHIPQKHKNSPLVSTSQYCNISLWFYFTTAHKYCNTAISPGVHITLLQYLSLIFSQKRIDTAIYPGVNNTTLQYLSLILFQNTAILQYLLVSTWHNSFDFMSRKHINLQHCNSIQFGKYWILYRSIILKLSSDMRLWAEQYNPRE